MDLTADNEESQRLQTQIKKWDRKKKKIITINNVRNLKLLINLQKIKYLKEKFFSGTKCS